MIDLPSGSVGASRTIVRTRSEQGKLLAFIAVAAEDRGNRRAGFDQAVRASLPADMGRKSFFVADWSGEALAIDRTSWDRGCSAGEAVTIRLRRASR
jgi:hypothetical protein